MPVSPSLLLAQLQRTFPAGATSGTFVVDQVLDGAFRALFDGLGIPATLVLRVPDAADSWTLEGDTVRFAGTLASDTFGLTAAAVAIRLTSDAGPTGFSFLMDVTLPAGWTFSATFPTLATGGLVQVGTAAPGLDGARSSALIVASSHATDPLRRIGGAALTVDAGLTFFGYLAPNATALTQFAALITSDRNAPVAGAIAYTAATQSVTMAITIAHARVERPPLDFAIALYSGIDAVTTMPVSGLRCTATIRDIGATAAGVPWPPVVATGLMTDADQSGLVISVGGENLAFPTPAMLVEYFGGDRGIAEALPMNRSLVKFTGLTFGISLRHQRLDYAILSAGAQPGRSCPRSAWRIPRSSSRCSIPSARPARASDFPER
jgi:hypothetical protein